MSSIYSWDQSESVLTATTTTVVANTDPVLYKSTSDARMRQTNVGNISAKQAFETITTSTAAGFLTLSPIGVSLVTGSATGAVALMPLPTSAGLYKSIVMGTSTTTAFQVICPSSSVAIITTGTSTNTLVPRLQVLLGQQGAYLDLMSISTSAWLVTGQSIGAGAIAYTTTTST